MKAHSPGFYKKPDFYFLVVGSVLSIFGVACKSTSMIIGSIILVLIRVSFGFYKNLPREVIVDVGDWQEIDDDGFSVTISKKVHTKGNWPLYKLSEVSPDGYSEFIPDDVSVDRDGNILVTVRAVEPFEMRVIVK